MILSEENRYGREVIISDRFVILSALVVLGLGVIYMQVNSSSPLIGILMGSDSDLPVMEKAVKVLKELDVPYEIDISSAHRLPDKTAEYARTARKRGLAVIIAGAGMAAHLAGVIAAHTTLPVIGVPLKSGAMGGVDALYATVQMPPGIPVATVAIDGAENAAYLACQILSVSNPEIAKRLEEKRAETRERLLEKSRKLKEEHQR